MRGPPGLGELACFSDLRTQALIRRSQRECGLCFCLFCRNTHRSLEYSAVISPTGKGSSGLLCLWKFKVTGLQVVRQALRWEWSYSHASSCLHLHSPLSLQPSPSLPHSHSAPRQVPRPPLQPLAPFSTASSKAALWTQDCPGFPPTTPSHCVHLASPLCGFPRALSFVLLFPCSHPIPELLTSSFQVFKLRTSTLPGT